MKRFRERKDLVEDKCGDVIMVDISEHVLDTSEAKDVINSKDIVDIARHTTEARVTIVLPADENVENHSCETQNPKCSGTNHKIIFNMLSFISDAMCCAP